MVANSFEVDLSASLLLWWDRHGRTRLPWKLLPGGFSPAPHQQLDPYPIWIAEVMLQQTQLSVVLPYWQRWIAAFPTVESLAAASLDDVLLQWQGLGYYARARRLHEAAQLLIGQSWPRTLQAWMDLPGIGRTTAGSILSSAFNQPHPILDGNVKRVLARLKAHPISGTDVSKFCVGASLLDPLRPRDTNQALMDLGALPVPHDSPSALLSLDFTLCCYAAGDPAAGQ